MKYFAVLIEPWAVYVKGWSFFCSQGGSTARWGKRWIRVRARNHDHAQAIGEKRRDMNDARTGAAHDAQSGRLDSPGDLL